MTEYAKIFIYLNYMALSTIFMCSAFFSEYIKNHYIHQTGLRCAKFPGLRYDLSLLNQSQSPITVSRCYGFHGVCISSQGKTCTTSTSETWKHMPVDLQRQ